ncbi:MAG: tetratricopeptide repeat protein [Pyrinomonadaceae bacterium]
MFIARSGRFRSFSAFFLLSIGVILIGCGCASGQGSVNYTGNGGSNSIQGRLVIPTGKRVESSGLRIRLQNPNSGDISVITDGTGSFAFRNLVPGSYQLIVEGGDVFDDAHESVFVDDFSSTTSGDPTRRTAGRTVNVQLYLNPKQHSMDPAAGIVDAKLAKEPKPARDKYEEAKKAVLNNDRTSAIAELREAVLLDQTFAIAWDELGLLLGASGDRAGSIAAFRRSVEADPKSTAALLHLGSALAESDHYREAETYLAAALASDPAQFLGHYYLGVTEVKLGRLDIAEKAFQKALELGGDKISRAHYMLGGVYWAQKAYSKAADELEKYLVANPKAADADRTRESIRELRSKRS